MASVSKHLANVGDVVGPLTESLGRINHASMFLGAGVVGTIVMEVSNQVDTTGVDEWVTLSGTALTDATGASVASLVGGGTPLYAHADVRGVVKIRLRKSAGAADPNGKALVTLCNEVSGPN